MNRNAKYTLLPASGVGIALQAKELVIWISAMIEAGHWIAMPDGPATLIALVAVIWPLGLLFPASDRPGQGQYPSPRSAAKTTST
jgi:hypothetical protein